MKIKSLIKFLPKLSSIFIVMIVVSVLTISPLTWHSKEAVTVEAGGAGRIVLDPSNLAQNTISAVENRIQTGFQGQTAFATMGSFLKESVLDGIGWTIAKTVLSSMVRSLINWVNSGFQGSPAFITDIKQHLLGVLDEAAGEFIRSLGGVGEFICSPFRLDVQAALTMNYAQSRTGMPSGPDRNMCRLSDIGSNIENFFAGMSNDWNDWLTVTSNPQNTPLGAYFAAEASLNARLVNEAGNEITLANWGNGFLSQRVCEAVEGRSGQNCTITTPGRVISEALTFSTSVGPRTLIEADEINELVGALLNQLVLQAMQGINGLLGLGGNPAFANYDEEGNTFLDNMVTEASLINIDNFRNEIERNIEFETTFLTLITQTLSNGQIALSATSSDPLSDEEQQKRDALNAIMIDARTWLTRITRTLNVLEEIATILEPNTNASEQERTQALNRYVELSTTNNLSSEALIRSKYIEWSKELPTLTAPQFNTNPSTPTVQ